MNSKIARVKAKLLERYAIKGADITKKVPAVGRVVNAKPQRGISNRMGRQHPGPGTTPSA